jgi:hypothetical protein
MDAMSSQPGVWVRTARGTRKQVTASGPTKGAARRKLQAKLDLNLAAPSHGVQPAGTVADLAEHWEDHKKRSGHARRRAPLSPQTRWGYHSEIARTITPSMGGIRLHELSVPGLEKILADLEDTGLSTVRARSVLSMMLDLAVRDGAIPSQASSRTTPGSTPRGCSSTTVSPARHHSARTSLTGNRRRTTGPSLITSSEARSP